MKRIASYLLGTALLISIFIPSLAVSANEMSQDVSSFYFPSDFSVMEYSSNLNFNERGAVYGDIIIDDPELIEELIELNDIYVPEGYELEVIQFLNNVLITYDVDGEDETEKATCSGIDPNPAILCLNYANNARVRSGSFYYAGTFRESTHRNATNIQNSTTQTYTKTTSSGWTATGSITTSAVTTAVGFNASTSMTVSESLVTGLAPNRTTVIHTWASASWTDFDTRNSCVTHRTGTGSAHRPVGIRSHVFTRAL